MRNPLLALLLACVACEPLQSTGELSDEVDSDEEQQALVVSPAAIDYGSVSVLGFGRAQQHFTVTNAGTSPLAVHGHDEVVLLEGDQVVFEIDAEPYFELLPGETRQINTWFTPVTEGEWVGELRVNYGLETLLLSGRGRAPVLELAVPEVEPTAFGCETATSLLLENSGSLPVEITDWDLEGSDAWAFDPMAGARVEPGATLSVPLTFAPRWDGQPGGARDALLSVSTDDPNQARLTVPLEGLAYEGELVTDRFTYAPETAADVVVVAETDGVMGLYVDRSEPALAGFFSALDEGNVDHHAAALTGGSVCPASSPPYVVPGTSARSRAQVLDDALSGGGSGAGDDRLLTHTAGALGGACWSGFLRAGAQLHVIAISGGPHGGGMTPDQLVSSLAAAAPDASEIIVSAVIATDSTGCGGATYGAGYADAAVATGGEIVDLCVDDWAPGFARLAQVSTLAGEGALTRPLDLDPLPASISVLVDGATFTGWTYDPEANAVVFLESEAPDAGSAVELRYMRAVPCAG